MLGPDGDVLYNQRLGCFEVVNHVPHPGAWRVPRCVVAARDVDTGIPVPLDDRVLGAVAMACMTPAQLEEWERRYGPHAKAEEHARDAMRMVRDRVRYNVAPRAVYEIGGHRKFAGWRPQ